MTSKKPRIGWPTILGIGISVPLLWWALRDIDLHEVVGEFRRAGTLPLLGATLVSLAVYPIRTIRWRYLLWLDGQKLPLGPLWHATAIGFMANNVLPARAGEVARAYVARRLSSVGFATALATIAVARLMDGVTLFLILGSFRLVGWVSPETAIGGVALNRILTVAAAVFAVIATLAVISVHRPSLATGAVRRALGFLPTTWVDGLVRAIEGLLKGLDALRSWRRFTGVMVWSLVVWGVNGISFLLCFIAFDLDVPWQAAYVLQSLINFGLVIPSTPGFVGVFEAVTRASLAIYGVSAGAAVSFAVTYHFLTYLPITLLGFWSLTRAHVHFGDIQEEVHERVTGTFHPHP